MLYRAKPVFDPPGHSGIQRNRVVCLRENGGYGTRLALRNSRLALITSVSGGRYAKLVKSPGIKDDVMQRGDVCIRGQGSSRESLKSSPGNIARIIGCLATTMVDATHFSVWKQFDSIRDSELFDGILESVTIVIAASIGFTGDGGVF